MNKLSQKDKNSLWIGLGTIATIIIVGYIIGVDTYILEVLRTPVTDMDFWHFLVLLIIYIMFNKKGK